VGSFHANPLALDARTGARRRKADQSAPRETGGRRMLLAVRDGDEATAVAPLQQGKVRVKVGVRNVKGYNPVRRNG